MEKKKKKKKLRLKDGNCRSVAGVAGKTGRGVSVSVDGSEVGGVTRHEVDLVCPY